MELRVNLLAYSGDTPVEDSTKWDNTEILIHEATFLDNGELVKTRDYGITERSEGYGRGGARNAAPTKYHSCLEEVMEMVSSLHIGQLILGHFSSCYSPDEIDRAIGDPSPHSPTLLNIQISTGDLSCRVLPGETVHDLLHQPPVNR